MKLAIKKYVLFCVLFCTSKILCNESLSTLFNVAYQVEKNGNIEQASQLYRSIIEQFPTCTQALYNYAHALKDLGAMHEAIDCYKQVIAQEPGNNFARFGLGQCYGALHDFEHAFALLEYRSTAIKSFGYDIEHLKTKYASGNSLKGIVILLRAEWGFGDIIQFIRYAQLLHDRGAMILVQSYKELQPLLSLCPFLDRVIAVGDAFPTHTYQIPTLSLPFVCAITANQCTPTMPYLKADEQLIRKWQSYLDSYKTFNIGICWQGNGDPLAPPLLNKNIPLHELEPLLHIPGVTIFSLQKLKDNEHSIAQLITFDSSFDHVAGRFMDTAALMNSLDLIITIDTSIAHLAGALHRPVWLLAPYRTDWRWGLQETTSIFYPSMRIFRQATPGGWSGVIQKVKEAINDVM